MRLLGSPRIWAELDKSPGLTNLTLETLLSLIPMYHLRIDIVLPIVSSRSL